MRSTFTSACRAALPIAALLASTATYASYTVIDDDLYPSSYMSETRSRALAEVNSDKFKIAFTKGGSSLNPMALSFLDEVLPRMRNAAQIRIVGRMDSASANENKKSRQLGTARASAIRTYLINHGISPSVLEIEVEADANPDASSGFSITDVLVSNPAPIRATTQAHSIPRQYRYLNNDTQAAVLPAAPAPATQPQTSTRSGNDEAMLQYINQAVQAGQMQPSVAAQIIRSMLEAKSTAVATNAAVEAAAPVAPAAIRASYVPAQERPPVRIERWTLDSRKTLKDNFDAWAAASGWKPTVWDASNFYQVTSNAVLDGAFPDILKRIADSTGLNICAYTREKYVRVTDAGIPCKKGAEHAY
ncbi:TcpQ domain-containing protein [Comamonas testosteroni]|jgi:hypothetical protein|uniref:TcpQ domain-containing protein n=1 Tax=Comamonas testosteroni TaxID=285 RepID=UPI0026F1F843|nr:TcpQ domain-containing protein [Comamonas testosteroni]